MSPSITGRLLNESVDLCIAVLEAIPYGVLIADKDGVVVDFNRTALSLLGATGEEQDLTCETFLPECEIHVQKPASAAGTGPAIETSLMRLDGCQIPVQVSAFEASDCGEGHAVLLLRDLRPNRAAEKRIMQRERLAAIGETVAALAHESRNALQRMQACLTLIRLRGNAEIHELTDDMQDAQDQLQSLYEEFRNYAAPMELKIERVDMRKLFRTVWRRLRMQWKPKDLELVIDRRAGVDETIDADAGRLSQVARNLLENAIEASPHGGRVEVGFRDEKLDGHDALGLELRDAGPGIAEDDREHIFDLLFTTKRDGTGMGLAIAKRIVLAHDGTIGVDTGEIAGARIFVTLPRAQYEG